MYRHIRTIGFFLLFALALAGCEADFDKENGLHNNQGVSIQYSSDHFWTLDTIRFTSANGPYVSRYLWKFGDGDSSVQENPIHFYREAGDYTVKLWVYGADSALVGADSVSLSIVQPTDLYIQCLENDQSTPLDSCLVTVYDNYQDYEVFSNPVGQKYTNSKGYVLFRDLDARVYYVDAIKREGNGYWFNDTENRTDTLVENAFNKYLVPLGYYQEEKAASLVSGRLSRLTIPPGN